MDASFEFNDFIIWVAEVVKRVLYVCVGLLKVSWRSLVKNAMCFFSLSLWLRDWCNLGIPIVNCDYLRVNIKFGFSFLWRSARAALMDWFNQGWVSECFNTQHV